jgi:hypothetical protein
MNLTPVDDGWELQLGMAEAVLLLRSLTALQRQQETPVEQLPATLREYWQGIISRGQTDSLEEAAKDLTEARLLWRGERATLLKIWIEKLKIEKEAENIAIALKKDDLEQFLTMINDRRLLLAAEYEITEREMDTDPVEIKNQERRLVLVEMFLLGLVMEQILQIMLQEG